MADYGEWNRKGAVLSEVTAQKEYGVTREFVVAGIKPEGRDCPILHTSNHSFRTPSDASSSAGVPSKTIFPCPIT